MLLPAELDRLVVVLVATRNPLNMGAAARAMTNFGFRHLRVVNPYDAAFRQARSAVGAEELLAKAKQFDGVADAVADCTLVIGTTAVRERELHHNLHRLEAGGPRIRKQLASGRVAILFGSEKVGLSNRDFSHCHWLLHIPTGGRQVSMNLGQAVAVTLYELIRDGKAARIRPVGKKHSATSAEVERMTTLLLEGLVVSGYTEPKTVVLMTEKTRRLIRRMNLNSEDAQVVLGMLRQILWKLKSSNAGKEFVQASARASSR